MNNAYYGRRRPMMGGNMPHCYRTANNGYVPEEDPVTPPNCGPMVLAMSYVPVQQWNTLYEIEEGFDRGTIFPELDKPFMGGGCSCGK